MMRYEDDSLLSKNEITQKQKHFLHSGSLGARGIALAEDASSVPSTHARQLTPSLSHLSIIDGGLHEGGFPSFSTSINGENETHIWQMHLVLRLNNTG